MKELIFNGYSNIGLVEKEIRSVDKVFRKAEDQRKKDRGIISPDPIYFDLAAARLSIQEANPDYKMIDMEFAENGSQEEN